MLGSASASASQAKSYVVPGTVVCTYTDADSESSVLGKFSRLTDALKLCPVQRSASIVVCNSSKTTDTTAFPEQIFSVLRPFSTFTVFFSRKSIFQLQPSAGLAKTNQDPQNYVVCLIFIVSKL